MQLATPSKLVMRPQPHDAAGTRSGHRKFTRGGRVASLLGLYALLVGFVMFMILGVALWIFPRPAKDDDRYDPRMGEVVYWLLTVGTAGRIAAEIGRDARGPEWLRWIVLTTGTLQVAALALFVWAIRSRIRAVGSRVREAKGERF